MIHLTYSNRTEELLAALAGAVREERARRGPWPAIELVVPNRSVEAYVKLGLAEALGLAANLRVAFLRGLLAELVESALPGQRLGDALSTQARLLALLHDEELLSRPALAEVRQYILGGTSADAIDRRRCQLAAEVSALFEEYAVSRPELLRGWSSGGRRPTSPPPEAASTIEMWQRELWLELFGAAPGSERRELTLSELVQAIATDNKESGQSLAAALRGRSLHVFGVSYVGRAYHAALSAIARHAEVHVYTLNPCREFWEDVETTGELRRRLKRQGREPLFPSRAQARQPGLALDDDPFGLKDERESLALRLWGRPGRENIRLLDQQGGGDFVGRFISNAEVAGTGAATLLARLQDDILDRALPPSPDSAAKADGSLRLLPCPGVRRELEVIAGEIWRLVEADPSLRLNQIALVIPEAVKDTYLSHVGAVFAEAHELPHSIIDLPLSAGHRLGEAAQALLALPLGGASRRELMPLLTHPALLARFSEASASEWLRLCEDLGIVHGVDHGDHAGTYIERDVLNWDQGIRRLCLGAFVDAGRGQGEGGGDFASASPVVMGPDAERYLPVFRPGDEQPGALGFAALARSLLADARFAAGAGAPRLRPLPEWLDFMRGLLVGYLLPVDAEEEGLLARLLAELDKLAELPLGPTPISYRTAWELASHALAGVGGARGQHLAHGVTVTSFVPMRAIPFRVIFVAGLGQGGFPRLGRRSELDLRAARRQPGDVSPREQDLYMFLETLLSARERLVLSYVARDELTGTPLLPSSVLLELRDILRGYLPPAELGRLFDPPVADMENRPALRRYQDSPRLRAGTLAHREHRARELGQALRAVLPAGATMPDLPALRRAMPAATFAALSDRLGVVGAPARGSAARPETNEPLRVSLAAIRQFLEDPLQGSARFRLRLREVDPDEELADREDEDFELGRPLRTILLREVMLRTLSAGEPTPQALTEALARVLEREELRGNAPTGFFAAAQRPTLEAILHGWHAAVSGHAAAAGGKSATARLLHFGRPGAHELVLGTRRDPIPLTLPRGRPVEIVGRTELQLARPDGAASLFFSCRSASRDTRTPRHRDRLRAFLDHVALSAADMPGAGGAHGALIAWSDGGDHELEVRRFRPLSPERARSYLASLITAMLAGARDGNGQSTGVHPYLLPCEAIFNVRGGTGNLKRSLVEEIQKLRDDYLEKGSLLSFSSVNGPVPEAVERHEPPPAEQVERMADERFGLYFELLEPEAPSK